MLPGVLQAWERSPKKDTLTFSDNYTHSTGGATSNIHYPNNSVGVLKVWNTWPARNKKEKGLAIYFAPILWHLKPHIFVISSV